MNIKYDSGIVATLSQAIGDDLVLLSALHATELEAQTLVALRDLGFPKGLGLRLHSEQAAAILNHLDKVIKQWPDVTDPAFLDDLAADYAAIYLNAQLGASPHESFWLDEEHLLMQKPMFEVRDCYQEQGMRVDNCNSRADDQIVNELNFLAEIINVEIGQPRLSVAASFLDEHLLRWIDQFAERVATKSESDFYSGLMLLTAVYCNELRDLLAVILDQPRPDAEEIDLRMSERKRKTKTIKVPPPQFNAGSGPTW